MMPEVRNLLGRGVNRPYKDVREHLLMECVGLNDDKKGHIIRGCLSRWKPMIVCLQETKMEVIKDSIIKSLQKY